jgi:integrase
MPKLTALAVKKTTTPGYYGDGGGLWLVITKTSRAWVLRFTLANRSREMGLGAASVVGLAEARRLAEQARAMVRAGVDPIATRRAGKAPPRTALTFAEVADRFIADREARWSLSHADEWRSTLRRFAYPIIGKMPVDAVRVADVITLLRPVWLTVPNSASRLLTKLAAVFDSAMAEGLRPEGPNPADRSRVTKVLPPSPKGEDQHYRATPWQRVPEFIAALAQRDAVSARALQFLTLTAARSGEVRGAMWSEIDLAEAIWSIPAARMKARRSHRVPLSAPALAVLAEMEWSQREPGGYVFPGQHRGTSMSDGALLALLNRIGWRDATTPHGIRSAFRDWIAEATTYDGILAEKALAHSLPSAVERAYQRSDLLERRRPMMEAWGRFATGEGVVVPFVKAVVT